MSTPVPSQDEHDPLTSKPLWVFIVATFAFLLLTFWLPIQDVLTHLLMQLGGDRLLQHITVPYELHVVSTLLTLLGFHIQTGKEYITWQKALGGNEFIYFTWNCGGWQSLLLFLVSAIPGLSGKHTRVSKWKTFLLGVTGTYLFTLFRLMAVLMIYIWCGRPLGILFHDYLTIFLTFGYLALFWWGAQRFILTEHSPSLSFYRPALRFVFGRGALSILLIIALLINYFAFFAHVPVAHAAGNPTIEQHVDIITQDETAPTSASGMVNVDPTNYTSGTFYFEVVAAVTSGSGTAVLTYGAGSGSTPSGGSTVTISNITATSFTRYRSASFSLTAGNAYVSSVTGTGTTLHSARIVIVQTDSTAIKNTETQVLFGHHSSQTTSSDFVQNGEQFYDWTSTNYDGTRKVYFEATMDAGTNGQTASVSLYLKGSGTTCTAGNNVVTLSTTSSTANRQRSADISGSLTNGSTYMICVRTTAGTVNIVNAHMIINQTSSSGITKVELKMPLNADTQFTQATSTYTSQSYLMHYDPNNWAGGTFSYTFHGQLKTSSGSNAAFEQLYNATDGSAISGSEVSTTQTAQTEVDSGTLTMPSTAKDLDVQIKNASTSTTTCNTAWLVITITSLQTPENLLPLLPLGVFLPKLITVLCRRKRNKGITLNRAKLYA